MKAAFISEGEFKGRVPSTFPNMRTEMAWIHALGAMHFNIYDLKEVRGYDHVFVIFPKGILNLNLVGSKIADSPNPVSPLLASSFISTLKKCNSHVHYIQEGPCWLFNDYEIVDQLNFYKLLSEVDTIFAHNECDIQFYRGLLPQQSIRTIPTLLIEELLTTINPSPEEKVIIGGNFVRWYGGFQSYVAALEFKLPQWTQSSHAEHTQERGLANLHHLPRLTWIDWMRALSTFKYAVHLMPTIAAGTFSLNCAYFGIPCIGNEKVDTQRLCHPFLSLDVDDLDGARSLAKKLKKDDSFYSECSRTARKNYKEYYNLERWLKKINLK